MNREQLIEKAGLAMRESWEASSPPFGDLDWEAFARAALAVFEEAHAPTRSIRECTICGEKVTMSNATEAWEKRHVHAPTDDEREAQGWREAGLYVADTVPSQRAEVMDDFMTGWRTADRTRRTVQAERPPFDAFGEPRNRAAQELQAQGDSSDDEREVWLAGERSFADAMHYVANPDDEREALRREFEYRIRTGWALAHAYEKGTITAQRKKELIRDEIDGAMASLAVAGFFRRTVQGEPTGYRATLIREARELADHYRRYDDTETLASTLVEMANALAAEPQREPSDAAVREAVSAERKAIASLLMSLGDRMTGEGTQAGYYAAAHEVRQRERAALRAAAKAEGGNR